MAQPRREGAFASPCASRAGQAQGAEPSGLGRSLDVLCPLGKLLWGRNALFNHECLFPYYQTNTFIFPTFGYEKFEHPEKLKELHHERSLTPLLVSPLPKHRPACWHISDACWLYGAGEGGQRGDGV